MITVNLQLAVNLFRTLGGIFPVSATMTMPTEQKGVAIHGKNLTITLPSQPLQFVFSLPDPNYSLLGVAFAANSSTVSVGMRTFPDIVINRTPGSSQMTVTDQNQNYGDYNYVILVQKVATGEIGIIDPGIENDPEN